MAQINTSAQEPFQTSHPNQFSDYWNSGKAEISSYELKQNRYGELRNGDVILIYVTEDFLIEKQVKKEFGNEEHVPILKMNGLKKFTTGIYDYSIMTSTFTPIEFFKYPRTLKSTFTSQDWCGQSFSQINVKTGNIYFQVRSYFQSENDQEMEVDATYFEDDIWTRIRLEPQALPLGKIEMIPSQEFLRLQHKIFDPYDAIASLILQVNDSDSDEFYLYKIEYPELNRIVEIRCQSRFPFKILSWKEELGNSVTGEVRTTSAKLIQTINESYWNLNTNNDKTLRKSLGLE